jgi:uncharacterized protein (TIGR03118 family)
MNICRCTVMIAALLSAVGSAGALAGTNSYLVTNLVANKSGEAAHTDAELQNPWGVAFIDGQDFWLADNNRGVSTLYNGKGVKDAADTVGIPLPPAHRNDFGKFSAPTGIVSNTADDFFVEDDPAWPAAFIFDSEDGAISAWFEGEGGDAEITLDNSQVGPKPGCPGANCLGAVYKGLALASSNDANFLYATNFRTGKIEIIDTNFNEASHAEFPGSCVDTASPKIPSDYAPYNIELMGGQLYVTYAKQDEPKHDSVAGAGDGYVSIFTTSCAFVKRLISRGTLNAPWGMVKAPASFGKFANDLLVGNFGDGKIDAYNPKTGAFLGTLTSSKTGKPIVIPGLWSLVLGAGVPGAVAGAVYFTAGGATQTTGVFGTITPSK